MHPSLLIPHSGLALRPSVMTSKPASPMGVLPSLQGGFTQTRKLSDKGHVYSTYIRIEKDQK